MRVAVVMEGLDDLPVLRIVVGLALQDSADRDAVAVVRGAIEGEGGDVVRQRSAVVVATFDDVERALAGAGAAAAATSTGTVTCIAVDLGDVIGTGANADGRPLERVAALAVTPLPPQAGGYPHVLVTSAAAPFVRRSRRVDLGGDACPDGVLLGALTRTG